VGHGPFAHFFDEHVLCHFPAPTDPRRPGQKGLSHEDLSQLIIERELGELIRSIRRAPGLAAERDSLRPDETIDPRWVSFLISKPAISDPAMPRWLRWLLCFRASSPSTIWTTSAATPISSAFPRGPSTWND
jgi:hypothetical protein